MIKIKKYFSKIGVITFVITLFSTILVAGPKKQKVTESEDKSIVSDEVSESQDYFIKGVGLVLLEDYEGAINHFTKSVELTPQNATNFYKIADCYYRLNKTDKAIEYGEMAIHLEKGIKDFYLLLSEIYLNNHDLQKSVETLDRLVENVPGEEAYLFNIGQFYHELALQEIRKKSVLESLTDKDSKKKKKLIDNKIEEYLVKSLSSYDKLESYRGVTQKVSKEKIKILTLQGQLEKVIFESEKLVFKFDDEYEVYLSHAEILLGQSRIKESLAFVKTMTEKFPYQFESRILYYELLDQNDQKQEARKQLDYIFNNTKVDLKNKILVVRVLSQKNEVRYHDTAFELVDKLVSEYPAEASVFSLKGDMLNVKLKFPEAREAYLEAIKLKPLTKEIWKQIIFLDSRLDKTSDLVQDSKKALSYFPDTDVFWFYNGLGNVLEGKDSLAIYAFEKGLLKTADDHFMSQFNTNLGDAYYRVNNYKESDRCFDKVLEYDPYNAHVLNNYSYFLSLRKEKLSQAKSMCEMLIRIHPSEPTYLDTYAWVLYQLEDYQQAKILLEKALTTTVDGAIMEHYGDVLIKLGEKEKALEYWRKALGNEGVSDELQQKIDNEKQ